MGNEVPMISSGIFVLPFILRTRFEFGYLISNSVPNEVLMVGVQLVLTNEFLHLIHHAVMENGIDLLPHPNTCGYLIVLGILIDYYVNAEN